MSKGTIVYIGGFELPDKNAAAHRVLNNGKVFRDLGYDVFFIGIRKSKDSSCTGLATDSDIQGFHTYSIGYPTKKSQWMHYLCSINDYLEVLDSIDDVTMVILYNFPAVAMRKMLTYCRKHNIKCTADVTEWYSAKGQGLVYFVLKGIDTWYRMRVLHKKLDGLIVISRFLNGYYGYHAKNVLIPPLVDKNEEKWSSVPKNQDNILNLVYAGSPGSKDQLFVLIEALKRIKRAYSLKIIGAEAREVLSTTIEKKDTMQAIEFYGRLPHTQTLSFVKKADYSCFFREDSRVTKAGFPTKLSESISCGTPVITNASSNITDYIKDGRNGIIIEDYSAEGLAPILESIPVTMSCDTDTFHYSGYIKMVEDWLRVLYA